MNCPKQSDKVNDWLVLLVQVLPALVGMDVFTSAFELDPLSRFSTRLDALYKISDLRYTLHLSAALREQCVALLPIYTKQASGTQERLTAWHDETTQRLGIETDEIRRKRAEFDSVIHFIPGLFNDDFNFRSELLRVADLLHCDISDICGFCQDTTER